MRQTPHFMEYNTQRKRLVMPEYGRHVQLLVEKLLSIEDRDERTREAYAVVQIMLGQNPQLRNVEEQERKVWEHLYMISNYELDVDAPYPMTRPTATSVAMRRRRLPYPKRQSKINHYGTLAPKMLGAICRIPSLERQLRFGLQTANQMKRSYLEWNKSTVEDAEIISDVERLSGGQIALANAVLEGSDFPSTPRQGQQQRRVQQARNNGQFGQGRQSQQRFNSRNGQNASNNGRSQQQQQGGKKQMPQVAGQRQQQQSRATQVAGAPQRQMTQGQSVPQRQMMQGQPVPRGGQQQGQNIPQQGQQQGQQQRQRPPQGGRQGMPSSQNGQGQLNELRQNPSQAPQREARQPQRPYTHNAPQQGEAVENGNTGHSWIRKRGRRRRSDS